MSQLTPPTDEVLAWGESARRDLPWRRTRDPWQVLVAEVMLQQTQVERVAPKWTDFIERFPTPDRCASAVLAEVLELWRGLGYPRRGRNLWLAAAACTELHGGSVPDDLDGLLALPGVGPYTARAVLTFAYERPVGVVDTNIARILARCEGRSLTRAEAQRVADSWVPAEAAWAWNQTLMDVGAGWCRPSPRCEAGCPLGPSCRWFSEGRPDPDPALGSAGVSQRQARFEGSDRQARGRLLAVLLDGSVAATRVAAAAGLPDDPVRAAAVAESLVLDGLASRDGDSLLLGSGSEANRTGPRSNPQSTPSRL